MVLDGELGLAALSMLLCALLACGARSALQSGDDAAVDGPASGCADPQPILQAGTTTESGFVRCADGFVHRARAATCVTPAIAGGCEPNDNLSGCATDADCAARPYGACLNTPPFGDCACIYGCASDADCDAGEVCACAGVVGDRPLCISATCAASRDCDGLCGLSSGVDSCARPHGRLACHGTGQECRVDGDCSSQEPAACNESSECRLVGADWSCAVPSNCGPCG